MDWNSIVTALGGTTIIVAAVGFIVKTGIESYTSVQIERAKSIRVTRQARTERVREEIIHWANPILGAVNDLLGRIDNITNKGGYVALSPEFDGSKRGWSMSYEYFITSTVYYFCQYFCWIRLLEEELSFEIFEKNEAKDRFFEYVEDIRHKLSGYPLAELKREPGEADDRQVFKLEQRALGEIMALEINGARRCMGYAEFADRWSEVSFRNKFNPVAQFVDKLNPDHTRRWKRLILMFRELERLRDECRSLLTLEKASRNAI